MINKFFVGIGLSLTVIFVGGASNILYSYVSPTNSTLKEAILSKSGLGE